MRPNYSPSGLPAWAGQTVVCIGSGPSLTEGDCEAVSLSGRPSIVTNTTFRRCPWADALFAFDVAWWSRYIAEVREVFRGRLFSKSIRAIRFGVEWPGLKSFGMSGTDAISLAISAGSRRVILLGYDAQLTDGRSHHHGDHPAGLQNCDSVRVWPGRFARVAAFAKRHGAEVINASRATALDCFPLASLAACL